MMVSKRNLLFHWLIFRFHVKLQGCIWKMKHPGNIPKWGNSKYSKYQGRITSHKSKPVDIEKDTDRVFNFNSWGFLHIHIFQVWDGMNDVWFLPAKLSNEKRAQNGCLDVYYGDEILPSYVGIILVNHDISGSRNLKQPRFLWKLLMEEILHQFIGRLSHDYKVLAPSKWLFRVYEGYY